MTNDLWAPLNALRVYIVDNQKMQVEVLCGNPDQILGAPSSLMVDLGRTCSEDVEDRQQREIGAADRHKWGWWSCYCPVKTDEGPHG